MTDEDLERVIPDNKDSGGKTVKAAHSERD